jgi:membrane-associated phospholipid phosphatase
MLLICLALLIALTILVRTGIDLPGDMALLQWAISLRNGTLTAVIQVITFFGSATPALVICTLLSGVGMFHQMRIAREYGAAHRLHLHVFLRSAWPLVAFIGMMICNICMRVLITRLPPKVDYLPQLLPELQADFQRYSYPSGHAGSVLVAYAAITIYAWGVPVARRITLVIAAILISGIGFGRVYLGVHWPSDVLAGYLLGAMWLALAWIMCRVPIFSKEQ